jgi:RNA polymerase sigma factor (sigma-70 family)
VDARTVESLYRVHGHSVLRRARAILRNEDDAREVLQEVFTSMLEAGFPRDSSITTWLYSVTTNRCLNRMRNQKTRARILDRNRPDEAMAPRAETDVIVHELLSTLPAELARVAVHYYIDDMTHDEIAGMLGCSRRHVGDLVERVRASVREEAT